MAADSFIDAIRSGRRRHRRADPGGRDRHPGGRRRLYHLLQAGRARPPAGAGTSKLPGVSGDAGDGSGAVAHRPTAWRARSSRRAPGRRNWCICPTPFSFMTGSKCNRLPRSREANTGFRKTHSCIARSTITTRSNRKYSACGWTFCARCLPACYGLPDVMLLRRPTCARRPPRGASRNSGLFFAPFESRERYRARFRLADLFLDTPVFNAMTTACDALIAGLPLLTVPGASFPSRVAASLLTAGGFADGIVPSLDAYRDQAVEWGRNPGILGRLRRDKLANPLATPLFDTAGRVRQLEMAYEEMWRRYRLGMSPESFDVVARPAPAWANRWH